MSLSSNVESRYPLKYLIQLTNPQDKNAIASDATRMGLAVDDTISDMEIYAGLVYDDTDNNHINVATDGVIIKLMLRTGQISRSDDLHKDWIDHLFAFSKITSRDRILPRFSRQDKDRKKPFFDPTEFDELIVGEPRGEGTSLLDID